MESKNIRIRVAGILRQGDSILLIKHQKNNKEYWLLPGGGVDYGETFQQALEREFLEETNLIISTENMVFVMESINPSGERHIVNFIFIVEQTGGTLKMGEEERLMELKFVKISELDDYVIFPNLKKEIKELFEKNCENIKYIKNRWENG